MTMTAFHATSDSRFPCRRKHRTRFATQHDECFVDTPPHVETHVRATSSGADQQMQFLGR
jgi:hypothetical protein